MRKLHQVHGQRTTYHGEYDTLVVTYCGERVSLYWNQQRVSHEGHEVTCRRCRASIARKMRGVTQNQHDSA